MRKYMALTLAVVCILGLIGCKADGTTDTVELGRLPYEATVSFHDMTFKKSDLSQETLEWLEKYNALSLDEQLATSYIPNDLYKLCGYSGAEDTTANDIILKSPPVLTVVCGEETVEALRGTTSWLYQNEDGTGSGIEADSMHPLQAKEYMTQLDLIPTPISSIDPLKAYLQWNTIPDKVLVRCWNEEYWGQSTAESEEIPVSILMIDSNFETAPIISVELKDGNYIYEVVAEWNSSEMYGGTAYYSFYTVKPDMKWQPIG